MTTTDDTTTPTKRGTSTETKIVSSVIQLTHGCNEGPRNRGAGDPLPRLLGGKHG